MQYITLHHDVMQNHWTPLHYAAINGHSSTVGSLSKYGADINAVRIVSWNVPFQQQIFILLLRKKQLHCIMLHKMVTVRQ